MPEEGLFMVDSQTGRKKGYWTRRNILDTIFVLGFILTLISTLYPFIVPVRAKLTIFIDHFEFHYTSESNSTGFTVFLKIVNDSPKSANVFYWNFSLNMKIPYQILSQTANRNPPLVLISSAEADISMSKTLIGQNNTPLPPDSFKSMLVIIQYEDDIGVQETYRIYDFPYASETQ
jgi:hypothetical protein